jgi:hypothetical protein
MSCTTCEVGLYNLDEEPLCPLMSIRYDITRCTALFMQLDDDTRGRLVLLFTPGTQNQTKTLGFHLDNNETFGIHFDCVRVMNQNNIINLLYKGITVFSFMEYRHDTINNIMWRMTRWSQNNYNCTTRSSR